MMIARRRAIDRVRSSVASAVRDRQAAPPTELWDQTHEAAADALDREQLARSLNELTGPQREAITLAYFGGHTHRQVAAILGAPLGTVKGRIREALIRLRSAMTSDELSAAQPRMALTMLITASTAMMAAATRMTRVIGTP